MKVVQGKECTARKPEKSDGDTDTAQPSNEHTPGFNVPNHVMEMMNAITAAETAPADKLLRRYQVMRKWLKTDHPEIFQEQKHTNNEDSPEKTYWHYGYQVALGDMLALLGNHPAGTSSCSSRNES